MAVCIKNLKTKEVSRVSREQAAKLVSSGKYEYARKADLWRQQGKLTEVIVETEVVE